MLNEVLPVQEVVNSPHGTVSFSAEYTYEDLPLLSPVNVTVHAKLGAMGIHLKGTIQADLEEPCDRCLELYHRFCKQSFEELFVFDTLLEAPKRGEFELHSDDFYDTVDPEAEIDVRDLISQHLIIFLSHDRICNTQACHEQANLS
jgi:uncharacterized metal-binding protein YceD (DUF177 family)